MSATETPSNGVLSVVGCRTEESVVALREALGEHTDQQRHATYAEAAEVLGMRAFRRRARGRP